jgi:hypothetical protein
MWPFWSLEAKGLICRPDSSAKEYVLRVPGTLQYALASLQNQYRYFVTHVNGSLVHFVHESYCHRDSDAIPR